MEEELGQLKRDVAAIKERNRRVEADKAWETSRFRIFSITVVTYIIAAVALFSIGNSAPFTNALIPTIGFFLSVQSLPLVKRVWIERVFKKKSPEISPEKTQ